VSVESFFERHLSDPRRERGFVSALGFTAAFGTARAITHAIKHGVGPFGNMSAGGTHIHHSTFGIFGLLGVGYAWTYRRGIGDPSQSRWPSRISAAAYGVAAALTLDEFALWLNLEDDYWNDEGRKSIDAVALFLGCLAMGMAGRSALDELGLLPKALKPFA
jgi:hypothetical protein